MSEKLLDYNFHFNFLKYDNDKATDISNTLHIYMYIVTSKSLNIISADNVRKKQQYEYVSLQKHSEPTITTAAAQKLYQIKME